MLRLTLPGAVLVAVLLLGIAPGASALVGGPYSDSPVKDPAHLAQIKAWLRSAEGTEAESYYDEAPVSDNAQEAKRQRSGLFKIRQRLGVVPKLRTLSTIPLIAGTFSAGWKIGSPLGGYVYYKLAGPVGTTSGISGTAVTAVAWKWDGSVGPQYQATGTGVSNPPNLMGPFYVLGYLGTAHASTYYVRWCGASCSGSDYTNSAPFLHQFEGSGETKQVDGSYCGSSASQPCYVRSITEGTLNKQLTVTPSNSGEFGAFSAGQQLTAGTSDFSDPSDDAVNTAIDGAIEGGDPDELAALDGLNEALDPTYVAPNTGTGDGFTPFVLPRPDRGETAEQYVDRLRDKGWHGTATFTDADDSSFDPGSEGADAPAGTLTGVRVGGTPVVFVFSPDSGERVAWPPNPPVVGKPTTAIELRKIEGVPDDEAGGSCPCPIHDLDFGPLTEIDYGEKFPFGIVGWIGTQLAYLDPAPEPPHISVTIPSLHAHEWETGDITFGWDFADTDAFDWYISTIRTALGYLLWLGGSIYLGTRILNLRGAPDTRIDGENG